MSTDPNSPVLEVRNVRFGYDRESILEDVNLTVRRGDFLGVIGPNGGGKTTLVKIMLGLLRPWSGQVRWRLPRRAGAVGYVPQFSTFDKDFPVSVASAVLMGRLGRRGLFASYGKADYERAGQVMRELRIERIAKLPIGELSGGQLQRALIARALVGDPEILFLDEPTASVDLETRSVLNEILHRLNERIPIIMVTHDVTAFSSQMRQFACVNRRLFYHAAGPLTSEALQEAYGCPVELVAHGVPHRVLERH